MNENRRTLLKLSSISAFYIAFIITMSAMTSAHSQQYEEQTKTQEVGFAALIEGVERKQTSASSADEQSETSKVFDPHNISAFYNKKHPEVNVSLTEQENCLKVVAEHENGATYENEAC